MGDSSQTVPLIVEDEPHPDSGQWYINELTMDRYAWLVNHLVEFDMESLCLNISYKMTGGSTDPNVDLDGSVWLNTRTICCNKLVTLYDVACYLNEILRDFPDVVKTPTFEASSADLHVWGFMVDQSFFASSSNNQWVILPLSSRVNGETFGGYPMTSAVRDGDYKQAYPCLYALSFNKVGFNSLGYSWKNLLLLSTSVLCTELRHVDANIRDRLVGDFVSALVN